MEERLLQSPDPNGLAETAQPEKAPDASLGNTPVLESIPYTRRLILILFCAGLGFLFDRMLFGDQIEVIFPLFFLLCAGAVLLSRRHRLACRGDALLFFLSALALSLLFIFGPNGHRSHSGSALILFNIPILPALCMLSALFAATPYPLQREGLVVVDFFRGWMYLPLRYLFSFFAPFLSLFSRKKEVNWANVLLGLVIALPLSVGVLALLARADTMMEQLLHGLLYRGLPGDLLLRLLLGFAAALLSHSCLYGLCREKRELSPASLGNSLPSLTVAIPTVCLLIIYLIFGYIQFRYLFSGRLPADLTYAEYARKGFSEILTVAFINLCLFGCSLRYVPLEKGIKHLLFALLLSTGLLLASSMLRLWLYIAAYGLTLRRVLSAWFLLYLALMLILCFYRLYRKGFPLLRWGLRILTLWYVILNIPNWPSIFSHWT
ncbi:MAG: DUF4173 domain-containing protein [Clostridia bacterium]|nr:DUF4173 domain-containing protein [Clostridia bacterium]